MPWAEVTDPNEIAVAKATLAGKAAGGAVPAVIGDRDRLNLQAAGVPVLGSKFDPLARIVDPKQRAMAQQRMLSSGQSALNKDSNQVEQARGLLGQIDEFRELNREGNTGGLVGLFNRHAPSWALGSEAQRMNQLTNSFARGSRQVGEGAISDYEGRIFQQMVGGSDKNADVNERFAKAAEAVNKARIDYHSFRDSYLQSNGTMIGADRMWSEYNSRHPMFDDNGSVRGRPHWSDDFANRARKALAPGGAPPPRAAAPRAKMPRVVDFNSLPE